MAINPSTKYTGQIDTTDPTGYPYGKAKNVTTAGDGTGTPLEKDWVNDVLGFFQALLNEVSATPTGTPEKVGASQLLDAIKTLYGPPIQPLSILRVSSDGTTDTHQVDWEVGAATTGVSLTGSDLELEIKYAANLGSGANNTDSVVIVTGRNFSNTTYTGTIRNNNWDEVVIEAWDADTGTQVNWNTSSAVKELQIVVWAE